MKLESSRRQFLKGSVGALAVAAAGPMLSGSTAHALIGPFLPKTYLYPPMDLSYFDTPITAAPSKIHFGFTSMTWGSNERQAIEEVSALGFTGIQMRATAVTEFKPSELRDLLQQHHLAFVALSSGELNIDPAVEKDEIAKHVANAKFVRESGGLYLQVLDQLKPRPRTVTPEECKRLGRLLTELGKRTADVGVTLGYHNHMNTISERPENLARVLDASDARYVKLLFDTAHYLGGGGDPAKAVEKYHHRLLFVHVKDMVDAPMGTEKNQKYPFKFVELGEGRVDIPAFFVALHKTKFRGWAIVELDRVPDKSRTPKDSAAMCRKYIEERLKVTL
jgi:inosose dehydratase